MIGNIFTRKRITAFFVALAMVLSCLVGLVPVGVRAEAAASRTLEEAVNWINNAAATQWSVDVDGVAGIQCVDLVKAYYQYLGYSYVSGNACEYATNNKFLMDGWYRDDTPSPGAIIAWPAGSVNTDLRGSNYGNSGSTGHVGLVVEVSGSYVYSVETNYAGRGYAYKVTRQPANAKYIHPNFKSSVEQGTPMTSGAGRTIPDGDYHIVSYANSDYGVAAVDPFINSNTNIHLWNDMASDTHVFTITYLYNNFYKIVHKKSGLCLDVQGANKIRGANVQLFEENGYTDEPNGFVSLPGSHQQWSIERDSDGSFMIRSRVSGYYLDITDAHTGIVNGKNIQMWERSDANAQNWRFIPYADPTYKPLKSGPYRIENYNTGKYLNANPELNAAVTIGNNSNDKFFVRYVSDGSYRIGSMAENYCIDVPKSSPVNGTKVEMFTRNDPGTDNQKWIIKDYQKRGGGYYNIVSKCNGLYLDKSASNAMVYYPDGTDTQEWRFERLPMSETLQLTVKGDYYFFEVELGYKYMTYGETLAGSSFDRLVYYQLQYYDYDKEGYVEIPGKFVWDEPTIKPAVADSNKTKYKFKFIPDDMEKYGEIEFESYASVKVVAAEYPDGVPSTEMSPAASAKKVGDIKLSENWKWDEADANTVLEDDTPITATALYTGEDGGAGNFVNESVTVTITRSKCTHPENKREIRGKIEPDCTNDGYTGDTYCTECDTAIEKGSIVRAVGHKYGNWKMTTAPTCMEGGVLEAKCSVCGDVSVQNIDALGHSITKIEAQKATCESSGNIEYWSCETCGKLFGSENGTDEIAVKDVVIPAAGHKEDNGTTDPETGKTVFSCSVCGAVIREESSLIVNDEYNISVTTIDGRLVFGLILDVAPSELNTEITSELDGAVLAYNIRLLDGTKEVQPSCTIKVSIPVPDGKDGAKIKVHREESNGSFTDMNAVYDSEANAMVFETSHLSLYVLSEEKVEFVKGDVDGNGELTPRDLTILGKAYMNETITAEQIAAADMDGNGQITPKDITALGKLYMSMQS